MDQAKLKLEARLQALEYVIIHVGKIALMSIAGYDEEKANVAAKNLREAAYEKLGSETLPGIDAALADHVMAEIREAADKLFEGIESVVAKTYRE